MNIVAIIIFINIIHGMKFKGNILLITLFLLMMSSLSALLVTAYIKNLIKLSSSFHNYYKSYYVANAWLELSLVKTNGSIRAYWFEDAVNSGSTTVTSNFSSTMNFTTSIAVSSTSLGNKNTLNSDSLTCNGTNLASMWYEIAPWWCVPIILLRDDDLDTYSGTEWRFDVIGDNWLKPTTGDITLYASNGFTALLTKMATNGWTDTKLKYEDGKSKTYAFTDLTQEGHNTSYRKKLDIVRDINGEPLTTTEKAILMIANTTSTTWYYCLDTNGSKIPTQFISIDVKGTYGKTTLNLKWLRKSWLPADFCYTTIWN